MTMIPPNDRETPDVTRNDADEIAATEHRNGNGHVDAYDMQALIDAFGKLPTEEQTKRLLHLYLAIQGDDGLTRKDLANHKVEDNHEFNVINEELEYQSLCLNLIMAKLGIDKPDRADDRPRRRG